MLTTRSRYQRASRPEPQNAGQTSAGPAQRDLVKQIHLGCAERPARASICCSPPDMLPGERPSGCGSGETSRARSRFASSDRAALQLQVARTVAREDPESIGHERHSA